LKSQSGDSEQIGGLIPLGATRLKKKKAEAHGTPPWIEMFYSATGWLFAFAFLLPFLAANSAATAFCSFSTSTR
jgi:hypothetical protein